MKSVKKIHVIYKIHVSFFLNEKSILNMPNQRFHLPNWWAGSLSMDVSG
jgi:hypothetical protein